MADLTITFTVPDAKKTEIIDRVARGLGWQDGDADTKAGRIKTNVKAFLKSHMNSNIRQTEGEAASDTAVATATTGLSIDD